MLTSLSTKLYQAIGNADKQRPMKNIHASSIAACPRNQYLARSGVERLTKPSGAKILRWQSGHNIEAAIRPYIETVFNKVGSNERIFSKELDLTGEYDNYDAETKHLIEIKSVHDMAFIEKSGVLGLKQQDGVWGENTRWAGKNKWKVKETPYLHHEMQQYCYYLLLKEKGVEVTGIEYVYVSLSGRLVTYSTGVDEGSDIALAVNGRLKMLKTAWETQTPPPCYCNQVDSPLYDGVFKWCDYKQEDECCSLKLLDKKQ